MNIFELVGPVRKVAANQYVARCPAHEDRSPSLAIKIAEDHSVLLYCFAGCETPQVLEAMGASWADLAPRDDLQRPKSLDLPYRASGSISALPLGDEVASYPYTDEIGTLLFEVVRFSPKAFRQRRPDGSWGLKGVRRVLYRLPRVSAALRASERVWIVEGEKDVHALERCGETATTAPMGAGKWRSEYSQALAGGDTWIVADRDLPGRRSARSVALDLVPLCRSVRLLEPVRGKDVSDHLAAGFPLEKLRVRRIWR